MKDFFLLLLNNPLALNILAISAGLILFVVITIFVVAFIQGREITFWPPKISAHQSHYKVELGSGKNKKKLPLDVIWYENWSDCDELIAKDLKDSQLVSIISIKGRKLTNNPKPYRNILVNRGRRCKSTRLLLQSPNSSFVNERISKTFGWRTLEEYKQNLIDSIKLSRSFYSDSLNNCFEIGLYISEPIIKMFMFDNDIYVGFYTTRKMEGKLDGVLRIKRYKDITDFSKNIEKYYDSLWSTRKNIDDEFSKLMEMSDV